MLKQIFMVKMVIKNHQNKVGYISVSDYESLNLLSKWVKNIFLKHF